MGLKERLTGRGLPTRQFALRGEDDSTARAELAAARVALADTPDEHTRARVLAAEKAVEACYEQVTLRAMSAKAWELLVLAHPADKDATDKVAWNPETFMPAVLYRCVDSNVEEADWHLWLNDADTSPLSRGEIQSLWDAVLDLIFADSDGQIPKG